MGEEKAAGEKEESVSTNGSYVRVGGLDNTIRVTAGSTIDNPSRRRGRKEGGVVHVQHLAPEKGVGVGGRGGGV